MVSTRSKNDNSEEKAAAGTKRKEHSASSESKHESKAAKTQKSIEESIAGQGGNGSPKDSEMESPPDEAKEKEDAAKESTEGKDRARAESSSGKPKDGDTDDPIAKSSQREKKVPSSILEKGIIYFFARNRVGIEDADSVGDLQRTYFVLRPLPAGAKLADGPIPDSENNRLFALPKKTFPKSHKDRFMAFVEKSKTSIQALKDGFFKATEYQTKTSGTRRIEPVTPIGEGVYLITRTEGRNTHLVYMLTIPSELGEVQEDLGLRERGSFILSVKNPERPGPASARLPQGPEFPKEVLEEFRGLAWVGAKPQYLDYENCQILLIGENTDTATEPTKKDVKHDKETPKEEIEQLEHEDEIRVEHLHGDDTVFDDLKLSKGEYPQVPTTW